jgi:serine/threonine protein kinase
VEGMMYLQGKGVVHGDLHTGNILLRRSANDEMIAKLSDFGLSLVISDQFEIPLPKGYVKSPVRAPETCEGNVVHRNSDIYAFGCILCKLFDAEFDERNQDRKVPFGCPDEMRSLIKDCWEEDPAKRPSCNTIYQALTFSNMFKQEKTSINTVNLPVGKNGYVDDNPSNDHRGYVTVLHESIESGLE